jgi:AcrR family transcriptional regulator
VAEAVVATSGVTRTSRSEQAEQTKQRILAVASRLFGERGYEATSIQDIADDMKLTKAAVFYHYRVKGDILRAIARSVMPDVDTFLADITKLRSRRARIDAFIDAVVDVVLSRRTVIVVLLTDPAVRNEPRAIQLLPELYARMIHTLFGNKPTPEQVFALYAAVGAVTGITALDDLRDDELRPILSKAMRRLLNPR